MPRVENMGENVQTWCGEQGRHAGSTYDVCAACYQQLKDDPHVFDERLEPKATGEPRGLNGWGGDLRHPAYHYWRTLCAACLKVLTASDDRPSPLVLVDPGQWTGTNNRRKGERRSGLDRRHGGPWDMNTLNVRRVTPPEASTASSPPCE